MQIKTTMRYHHTSIKITKTKLVSAYAGKYTDVKGPDRKSNLLFLPIANQLKLISAWRIERSYAK